MNTANHFDSTRAGTRTPRRLPRWSEFAELIRPRPLVWNGTERRLRHAATIADLRELARRRTPRAAFDYTDGGAGNEHSMALARRAFERVEFIPRVLRDVSATNTATPVLGRSASMPVVFAPAGFTRVMHHAGERAVAQAAQAAGVPYTLSTMGTTSIEELAAAAPEGRHWFQLYLWRDRERSAELIERATTAGYEALVLTVDTPVAGNRLRDVRNGMTIPPTLTLRTLVDGSLKPRWWFNLLTTEPLRFASLRSWSGTVAELADHMFDPSATITDVAALRREWPGKLIVKGIQHPDDAVAVVDAGADAVVVSNHGGRQLDRAVTPLEQLPSVRAAIGERAEVYIDGGVREGADAIAALCLGADAVLVGRPYLYGLMAGGTRGVARAAEILHGEAIKTMQLLGSAGIGDLGPELVRWRPLDA
ncbi:alpha-hydroxy acid oxidase [Sciscionella marina]|uniref:alpha-hydroxy acid oxidase n=1 Tax=Sciscionella marina TaxID=508770 RepID=UPI00036FC5D9|nr:alpha-hydroxy acid oxidase [Sciscionella marina]